jgi:cell division protein FtsI (penicillin-binding protein 3)
MRGPGPVRGAQLRRVLLLVVLLVAATAIGLRSVQLTVVEGDVWLARAEAQQSKQLTLPAPRGTIYDRNGIPLAASRFVYSVAIAPREVKPADREQVILLLQQTLNLPPRDARAALEPSRTWRVLRGRYDERVRDALENVAGVHFERTVQRFYPHGTVTQELVGLVNFEGSAMGGIELELDSVLRGKPGLATVRRDHLGRPLPGAMLTAVEPVAGRDVYLTIDFNLQEVADAALRAAMQEAGSAGGELLLADPRTGEILAAVSRRRSGVQNWRAVMEPYEPGSTIKPFILAALISERRATMKDSVYAEQGRYVHNGRTINDVKPYGWLTLNDALRVSSNIVLAKVSTRFDRATQYRYLRDFGFGTPTAITYPSESSGLLRRPAQWTAMSQASLAYGYEISVTPLQLTMAYGALANGGLLMEPRLVREVRSRDGRVEHSYPPRVVRRVVSEEAARSVAESLRGAVESGTARAAQLGPAYSVAGKTGTTRVASNGSYRQGAYIASFAGFFPAEDPQLVFLVKIDEPTGAYYGGATAAPVTRAAIEGTLAMRNSPVDRASVATATLNGAELVGFAPSQHAVALPGSDQPLPGSTPYVLAVHRGGESPVANATVAGVVPDVRGLSLRDAVRRLHAAGFMVRVEGSGSVRETVPSAGQSARVVVRVVGMEAVR